MVGTGQLSSRSRRLAVAATSLALVAALFGVAPAAVFAANSVASTIPGNTNISLDTSSAGGSGTYTPLGNVGVSDSAGGGLVAGKHIVISAPAGFQFDTGSWSLLDGCGLAGTSVSASASAFDITLGATSGAACTEGVAGIAIRPSTTAPVGPASITVSYDGTTLGSAGTVTSVAGNVTHIGFVSQPSGGTVNTVWAGQPSVALLDQFNNTVSGASSTITISDSPPAPNGTLSCSPGSGTSVPTVAGVATFSGCKITDTVANGFSLFASSSPSFGTATSNLFNITSVVGLNKLVFQQQPGSAATAGGLLSQQPVVWYVDASNNLINNNSLVVQLQVTPGTGTAGAVLSCNGVPNPQVTVVGGVASFTNCSVNLAGTGYSLSASPVPNLPGSPTTGTSNPFNVGTGLADHLVFTQSPATTTGSALSPNPIVQVVSLGGVPVPSLTLVTLNLVPLSGSGILTCLGGNPSTTSGTTGSVTFTGCSVSSPGTYFLVATAPGLGSASSSNFTVGTGITQVAFATQPLGATSTVAPTGTTGTAWSVQPAVAVRTIGGATITSDYTTQITLSIASGTPVSGGPGTLTCAGGNTVTVYAGVAQFTGCSISVAGTGYKLRATVTSSSTVPIGSSVDSYAFNITGAIATQLAFTTQPLGAYTGYVPNGAAGTAFSVQPVVAVRTLLGVTNTSDYTTQITLSIAPGTPATGGPGLLSCTGGNTVTVYAGVATFTGCSINAQGTNYKLRATVTSSTTVAVGTYVDSLPFSLTQSTAQITLTTYPSVVVWGDPFTATVQFAGGGNHTFQLQRLAATDNGVWQTIPSSSSTFTTDSTGRAVIQYTPRFNGQYKVVFNGDSTLGAGTSNVRTVNVRNLVLLRPSWTGVKTVNVGFTQTYTATARPVPTGGLPGGVARVEFQFWKLVGGDWVKTKSVIVPLNSSGVGTLKYTWNSTGSWYIRAVTLPNPYNFVGSSSVQRVNVQ